MKKEIVNVSVEMIATSEGYYSNRIIRVGEKFQYKGGLNRSGGLPIWADPVDANWNKKVEVKEVVAPLLPPADLSAPVKAKKK